MSVRCFFGQHDYATVKPLTDLTILVRCRRCERKALATIAAGPELIISLSSRLGREYIEELRRKGLSL
jgi:hypothetical protein